MAWWQWLVGILLFIVALGVLIGIHELGHLGAAKLFHVYCFNYSIGFGPQLLHSKRSEKHETVWSLRAIPLGGFVAMYGEGMTDDEVGYVPPSRSLEGIARYKRGIIIAAGVTLNFILGFVLMFIHNVGFDHVYFYTTVMDTNNVPQTALVVSRDEKITTVKDEDAMKMTWDPVFKDSQGNIVFAYVCGDITISTSPTQYVLVFSNAISSTKVDPDLTASFILYKQVSLEEMAKNTADSYGKDFLITAYQYKHQVTIEEATAAINKMDENTRKATYKDVLPCYYQNKLQINYSVDVSTKYNVSKDFPGANINLQFYNKKENGKYEFNSTKVPFNLKLNKDKNGLEPIGVKCKRFTKEKGYAYHVINNNKYIVYGGEGFHKYDTHDLFADTWNEWSGANVTIFKALGNLFTGDISNLGGPIAIADASSRTLANFGFGNYLYMWGMISCNLAIINLLPFPGLDGWSLVVIAYEGITKKQIPTKVKGILSFIGLALLVVLAVAILAKDIIRLVVV